MSASLKQLKEIWRRLKPGQRGVVIGAALSTLALIAALVFYGSRSEYGVLFSDLKPTDAQGIVEKLKAANIPYQLTGGGTTISVPVERISELRLQMAASGALSAGHVGFDIFDRASLGSTDFTQQVNYRRAIEGELSKTLEGMDEVESVRVHITPPRESLFTEKTQHAKASVMLRIRQGRQLSRERTEAITSLIASAVEGLDAKDVAVMDTQGRLLSSSERGDSIGGSGVFNSQIEARRRFEADTAARIIALLEPISGAGRVRADVAADLDFSQVEQTEEKYDPKSQIIRSQQTTQELKASPPVGTANIVGARANDPSTPPAAAAAVAPALSSGSDQRTASTTNYEIDKTVRHTVGGGGRVARLSVSVLVDYKVVSGAATVRTPEELEQLQSVVAAAVGLDHNRGDLIVVQSVPFDQPATETNGKTWLEKNRELVNASVKYGMLVLAALLLLLFVIRPARRALRLAAQSSLKRANADGSPLALTAGTSNDGEYETRTLTGGNDLDQTPRGLATPRTVAELEAEMEAEVAREINSSPPEAARASALKRQVAERTRNNPEAIAMTLRGWLQEKES